MFILMWFIFLQMIIILALVYMRSQTLKLQRWSNIYKQLTTSRIAPKHLKVEDIFKVYVRWTLLI